VYAELSNLLLPVRQIQTLLEKVVSDEAQVQQKFEGYLDGTEDFWRRRFTFSPFPDANVGNLREALLDAYPYHYVRQPLKSLHNQSAHLLVGLRQKLRQKRLQTQIQKYF
jgi:hypothetical protein